MQSAQIPEALTDKICIYYMRYTPAGCVRRCVDVVATALWAVQIAGNYAPQARAYTGPAGTA
jgi:hypothetical protein